MKKLYSIRLFLMLSVCFQLVGRPLMLTKNVFGAEIQNTRCSGLTTQLIEVLEKNKASRWMGYTFPVIPLLKSIKDKDKRMFVFVESPLMGLPISFVGVATASLLKKMATGTGEVFNDLFFQNVFREYIAFQPTQMIRNGINIDSKLNSNQKVFLNWWVTTVVYSLAHAGSTLANASTLGEFDYGVSLVVFSTIWPLLTQQLQTRVVVPKLFYKYPTLPKLKKIYNPLLSTESLIEDENRVISEMLQNSKTRVQGESKSGAGEIRFKEYEYENQKYLLTDDELLRVKIALSDRDWIKWFRSDKNFDGKVKKIAKLNYWMQKTGVAGSYAVSLIAVYWSLRWWSVGSESNVREDWGPLTKLIQSLHAVLVENGITTLPVNEYSEVLPLMKSILENHEEKNTEFQGGK